MLKQEIIDFFEGLDLGIEKLIRFRRPEYLTPGQVEEAAKKLFKKLKRGELFLEPRQMPRWIWRRAFKVGGKGYIEDRLRFARADATIAGKDVEIANLQEEVAYLRAQLFHLSTNLDAFGIRKLCWAIAKILFWCPDEFTGVGV